MVLIVAADLAGMGQAVHVDLVLARVPDGEGDGVGAGVYTVFEGHAPNVSPALGYVNPWL